jgi:hypothetical protein
MWVVLRKRLVDPRFYATINSQMYVVAASVPQLAPPYE